MPKYCKDWCLDEIDGTGQIPDDALRSIPTLHFCAEFGRRLIDESDPEFDHCTCFDEE